MDTGLTVTRTCFVPAPNETTGILAASFYSRPDGPDLYSVHWHISRSDTCDVAFTRRSSDNGCTWTAPQAVVTGETRPEGTFRRHLRAGYADPQAGRFLTLRTEGVLPTDHPLEGMRQWQLFYGLSTDGGATFTDGQIILEGEEYDADHPLPGVYRGRSCVMVGELTCVPLTLPDGTLLVPAQASVLGPDGALLNPAGFTYTDALVIRGRWRADGRLAWEGAARVAGDPARSTRGMIEPTLTRLADGRLLMVMRGSNHQRPDLPGYRWASWSDDGGVGWSTPVPWTATDGQPFYSPSACSQLLAHSNGRLYWVGNIAPENPACNSPRYPLVLAEVDQETGLLIRDRIQPIDDRRPGEDATLTLSNFHAREDRETGEIVLHLSRFFAAGPGNWAADGLLYRLALHT